MLKGIFKKPLILYPFLFSVYPILFLYSHNIEELVFADVYIPLAVAFVASVLLYFAINLFAKERATSALVVAVITLFFFYYGAVDDALLSLGIDARDRYLLPIFVLVEILVIFFVLRARKKHFAGKITPALNAVAIVLTLFVLSNILFFTVKKGDFAPREDATQNIVVTEQADSSGVAKKPDIYYIILDEYLRPDKMSEIFGYDNAEFIDYLEKLGFFITPESETHTGSTVYSLASSLNMEPFLPETTSLTEGMELIRNNRVGNFLKSQGYKTVIFNNSNTGKDTQADYNFFYENSGDAQKINFYQILLKNSMSKHLFLLSIKEVDPALALSRGMTLSTLSKLTNLNEVPSPKFVFAHIESPHIPFVFNRKGGAVDASHEDDWESKKYYLDQYIYITGRAQEVIDELLAKNKENPPIIIVQSDHGIRKNYLWEGKKKSISYISMNDWRYIFNAYYLPGFEGEIPKNIAPVETFNLIFSRYFN